MLRYTQFLISLFNSASRKVELPERTYLLLANVADELRRIAEEGSKARQSRMYIDHIGHAAQTHREAMYRGDFGETKAYDCQIITHYLTDIANALEQTIKANRRDDGLYHAYNLIQFTDNDIEITHLYEMLEGQVAVLTSGVLSAAEAADLLDSMRHSALYREDQRSYMLYPARRRNSFLEMNNLPPQAQLLPAVERLLTCKQNIIVRDEDGGLHFNGGFNNATFLEREAEKEGLSEEDIAALKALYEQMFNHKAFTGRSGTFYKYEGLGCIYWHMVSKLLLAVAETIERAEVEAEPDTQSLERLRAHYRAIREGIGSHKQPAEYGSFPFDAYSHTPSMAGVQQPGMTGQVKEDIINRFFELGVSVRDGQISFSPRMLTDTDFAEGELCFTYCLVPVFYRYADEKGMELTTADGQVLRSDEATLSKEQSKHVFERDGYVKQIKVNITKL